MTRPALWIAGLSLALALSGQLVHAADDDAGEKQRPPATKAAPVESESRADAPAITEHSITVDGEKISYTATAGYIPLTDDSGKLQANIFFVAYVSHGDNAFSRPITFAFNGGPGASSMWLHLGVGPKRATLEENGTALPRSSALADNESTWLGFTDLVFVDPIGTGFSRAAEGVDPKQFYEVSRDIQVAGSFIRRYVTRYQRWLSPKFILGESYGTTRAAGLTNRLQDAAGINVNGVILLSSVLSFQTISFEPGNDLPYMLALPSYAASAWYHKKLKGALQADLSETLKQAEQWSMNEYAGALAKGDALPDAERVGIAERMAQYTGLSREELQRNLLRVGPMRFGKQLLRGDGRILGRFDSRVTSVDGSPGGEYAQTDPSFFLVTGPLVEALNHYLQHDLKFRTSLRYEFLSKEANHSWKWNSGGQGYVYVADELAEAMAHDNRLRVFAGAGYYDLATPYVAQRYSFDHMGLHARLRKNLTFKTYPAGHQIYTEAASVKKLKADVEAFVRCALAEKSCG